MLKFVDELVEQLTELTNFVLTTYRYPFREIPITLDDISCKISQFIQGDHNHLMNQPLHQN